MREKRICFFLFCFYGTCSYIYYTFAQDCPIFAQNHRVTLRIVFVRSKCLTYAQNDILFAQTADSFINTTPFLD
jgi:hypothetical protein